MSQQEISTYLPAILIAVGFGAQAFVNWRQGISKASNDGVDQYKKVVEAYEKRIEQLTKDMKDQAAQFQLQLNAHTKEIGQLTAQVQEKDKQLKEYLDILKERDPASNLIKNDIHEIKGQVAEIHDFILKKFSPVLPQNPVTTTTTTATSS